MENRCLMIKQYLHHRSVSQPPTHDTSRHTWSSAKHFAWPRSHDPLVRLSTAPRFPVDFGFTNLEKVVEMSVLTCPCWNFQLPEMVWTWPAWEISDKWRQRVRWGAAATRQRYFFAARNDKVTKWAKFTTFAIEKLRRWSSNMDSYDHSQSGKPDPETGTIPFIPYFISRLGPHAVSQFTLMVNHHFKPWVYPKRTSLYPKCSY